jgi:hypothetical protein
VPGFLVGGPHTGGEDTAYCENYVDKPATSWIDKYCSSATNEVAINWNAPLAYCVNALEALYSGGDTVAGFRTITTGVPHRLITPQEKNLMTITRNGNTLVFESIINRGVEAHSIFTLFNASGKLLARIPAISGQYQGKSSVIATIPSGKLANGLLIVQIKMNGRTVQQTFTN